MMKKKQSDLNIESVHRLGHVAIRVDDVDRAKRFYMNLGMKLVWDDADWCYLEAGESRDGLALLGPAYKAAAQRGWIDEKAIVLETLLSFKRAGANLILTYHACDAAGWLKE